MGIYTVSVQSIVIFPLCLEFTSYFNFNFKTPKKTCKFKTEGKTYDWLNRNCVNSHFEVLSFDWRVWNILNQHRFQDMIAEKTFPHSGRRFEVSRHSLLGIFYCTLCTLDIFQWTLAIFFCFMCTLLQLKYA